MSDGQYLAEDLLLELAEAEDIEKLDISRLESLFRSEKDPEIRGPGGAAAVDPRDELPVLFNPGRARRPEDYSQPKKNPSPGGAAKPGCIICQGKTTGIVDYKKLGNGYTFINKNLFPIVFPEEGGTYGYHLLQWTSNHHENDWHNMPVEDVVRVMKRTAAVEKFFINQSDGEWFVSIIKNQGPLVGGSLSHGHQQIIAGPQKPRSVLQHQRFEAEHGAVFSAFMLDKLQADHVVVDYGPGVLLVPYYMKRPYDMLFILRDTGKSYIHQLDDSELDACARSWHDALGVYYRLFPAIGRELAFNVIVHNGPGTGLYVEFLPYTQETGGFEHLGLYCSQGSPADAARIIREEMH